MNKVCSICKKPKDLSEFYPHNKAKDGFQSHCKKCHLIIGRKWYTKNNGREKARLTMQRWRNNNPEKARAKSKYYREKYRDKYNQRKKQIQRERVEFILQKYGGKCVCCGEKNWRFLTLDHMNNDGKEHRKRMTTSAIYTWAMKNDYPKNLQAMCFNCNCGRYMRGNNICPHKIIN